ncbi:hypothetical protein AGR7C_pTi0155 [Agrobacterium deltaense Zutra 3/1]|uniref:Uncharacterized protein n=1 Tax=Agrobacterium deltaense Zutra 3/1 TaxID=1183427 RepID=A0A1S7S751_9HYPH|nr:hypothetical protein AGR7C_pTi0155 [Agrobacterium deltaense Zutra 3/1]
MKSVKQDFIKEMLACLQFCIKGISAHTDPLVLLES